MFKKTLAMAMAIASFLNIKEKEIPIADGKVAFTEDQRKILNEGFTEATIQDAITAMNKEIAEKPIVQKANSKLDEALKAYQTAEEAAANLAKKKDPEAEEEDMDLSAKIDLLTARAKSAEDALTLEIKNRDAIVAQLMGEAEVDTPLERILNSKAKAMIKHSATHLMSSNKTYDAFDGRNWNKQAAGKSTTATDWADAVNIQKLNGDSELYYRENPDALVSLHRDNFGLPGDWKKKMNVVDIIASGTIASAELSQGRKLNWAPKNNQDIQAEEGKIYPISVDMEFVGHILSEIEASWLMMFNKEGSQAYKVTFVRFLVSELDKRLRLEDRIATTKGVYVKTPDNANKAGRFINRQNGLFYLLWKGRDIDKKYRSFNIGTPTFFNIVDYIKDLIEAIPSEARNGLTIYLSEQWLRAYKNRSEQIFGPNNDYTGYPTTPKDFPNIKFQELDDLSGSDFMFVTYPPNIEILENIPKEKSLYRFEYSLRKIYVFADYKLGIRPVHIGNKIKDGDPAAFKVQTIWSNNVPVFPSDFFVPVFDDTTGEITATFNQLKVDDAFATDITKISGLPAGTIVKIQGDTALPVAKNVINNANFDLTANFDLSTGGTLTMRVNSDLTLKELARTTSAPTSPAIAPVSYIDGTLDAAEGSEFVYGASGALTITEILNGVNGQEVKIYGNDTAASNVTINDTASIEVAGAAVLALEADFVELVLVDGKWIEFNRSIA